MSLGCELYLPLIMLAHHRAMKTRDNKMSAVIKGLQREHGLLAAYLEASDEIDWQALHRRVVITETPEPVNVEARRVSAPPQVPEVPQLPEVAPSTSPFVFRRANLVRSRSA
jgi:hypothetical protein